MPLDYSPRKSGAKMTRSGKMRRLAGIAVAACAMNGCAGSRANIGESDADPTELSPPGPGEVPGTLDTEVIRTVIHANRGEVGACFESLLAKYPTLEGKVRIRFVILGTGIVGSASVVDSTAGDPELWDCVISRLRTWVFPEPKGNGVVTVTYPFLFKQSNQRGEAPPR